MANTFDWIEIRVLDTGKSAEFFQSLFGWRVVRRHTANGSNYWIFDTGDEPRTENLRRGALWLRPDGADLGTVVYVAVEDIDAVLSRVVDLGGEVVTPKTAEGAAFTARFSDPDGNLFGLWQD